MQHRWVSGRHGTEWGREIKRCGLGVFWRITDQVWSPALTERRSEYGAMIGSVRVAVSWTNRVWTDGKQPAVERTA